MTDALKIFLEREFHTPADVAKFGSVSKGIVYLAIERGELPARKITPRLFRVRTVDALIFFGIPVPAPEQYIGSKN